MPPSPTLASLYTVDLDALLYADEAEEEWEAALERWRESRVANHWARWNRLQANPHRATKRNLFGSRPIAPKRSPLQMVVSPQVSPVAALAPFLRSLLLEGLSRDLGPPGSISGLARA